MFRQALFGLVLSVATGLTLVARAQGTSPTTPRPPVEIPLARLQPDAKLAIALEPGSVASDDAVWTLQRSAGTLIRIQSSDNAVGSPIALGSQPCASLVVAFETVWAPLCGDRALQR